LVNNITEEGITFWDLKHIDPDVATKNSIVHSGEIVINRCGNDSGVAAVVPPDLDGAVLCGFAFRLVLKDKWDPYYVTAFLNSPLGRKQMLRIAAGSVLDHITKADLQKVRVVYIPKNSRDQVIKRMREAIDLRMESRKRLADLNKTLAVLEDT
jgi:restriction endonuclease S subunit